jgi:hypothetical protein
LWFFVRHLSMHSHTSRSRTPDSSESVVPQSQQFSLGNSQGSIPTYDLSQVDLFSHAPKRVPIKMKLPGGAIQAVKHDSGEEKKPWVRGELSPEQRAEIAESTHNQNTAPQKWVKGKIPTAEEKEGLQQNLETQEALRPQEKLKQAQIDQFLEKLKGEQKQELTQMGAPELDAPRMSIAKPKNPEFLGKLKEENKLNLTNGPKSPLTREKGKKYIGEEKEESDWRNQDLRQPNVDTRRTQYWNETERANHELSIDPETGLLMSPTFDPKTKQRTLEPLDTSSSTGGTFKGSKPGRHIFAQSPEGKLYSADPEAERKIVDQPKSAKSKVGKILNKLRNNNERIQEDVHHSTFLSGEAVAAAGEIEAQEGVVKTVSDRSGHYRPTSEHIYQTVHQLQEGGARMVDETLVNAEGQKVDTNSEEFKAMSSEDKRKHGISPSNRRAKVEINDKQSMHYDYFLATEGFAPVIEDRNKLNQQIKLGENKTTKEMLEGIRQDRKRQIIEDQIKLEKQKEQDKKDEELGYQSGVNS